MPSRHSFFNSSVGSKYLIAFTGLSLVGFLIVHLVGNLLVYVSPEAFNHYSDKLIKNPLVIPAELGLVALFLLHAYKAVRMFLGAKQARPVGYAKKARAGHTSRKSWASTTMILSGTFLLLFVPFHLKTFKYGPHYESPEPGVRDLLRDWSPRSSAIPATSPSTSSAWRSSAFTCGTACRARCSRWASIGSAGRRCCARIGWTVAIVLAVGFLSIPLYFYFLGARS